MIRRALWAAIAAAACAKSAQIEWVGLPDPSGAKTMVIAYEASGRALDVRAVDLGAPPERIFPLMDAPKGESVTLEALGYVETSSALGLGPGKLDPALPGAPWRKVPEAAKRIWSRRVSPELDPSWRSVEAPSRALLDFETPAQCDAFQIDVISVAGTNGSVSWAVTLDASSALFGTYDGQVVRVRNRTPELVTVTGTQAGLFTGAMLGSSGDLWLATAYGALFRAELRNDQLGASYETRCPDALTFAWLDGSTEANAFEIDLLSRDGKLWRYTDRGWSRLFAFDIGSTRSFQGGVVHLGLKNVLAAVDASASVFQLHEAAPTETRLFGAIGALASFPGYPAVAAAGPNHLYLFDGTAWATLPESAPPGIVATAIAPYKDGMLVADYQGCLQYYARSAGGCPIVGACARAPNPRFLVRAGDDFVLLGNSDVGRPTSVAIARRAP